MNRRTTTPPDSPIRQPLAGGRHAPVASLPPHQAPGSYARIRMATALLDASLDEVPAGFVPLWFHNQLIGAVSPPWVPRLDPALFELEINGAQTRIRIRAADRRANPANVPGTSAAVPGTSAAASFDARLQAWARQLKQAGLLPGWRGEPISIFGARPDAPLFSIERALLRPLGMLLRTVQVNVFTCERGELRLWSARRSAHKAVDPGLFDSLVAGGIGQHETPMEALFREAAEEAGLPASLSRRAMPSGIMDSTSVCQDDRAPVLHRERMHVFDLQVPVHFVPTHPDQETESAALLDQDTLLAQIRQGAWTREGAWASLNLIQRYRTGALRWR